MNKHILFVMRSLDNPELFTQEEKEANKIAAYAAYDAAAAAADAAYAAYAADVDAYAAYGADAADVEYWVNLFFKRSGEDKHVYINEVERLKEEDNKHIHHDLMIQYAKDTSIEIEVMETHYDWGVTIQPAWDIDREYRIKPKPERKPFNLEEALAGKRVVTTEGDEVTQLVQFESISYPDNIYGVVKGVVICWNGDGSYSSTSNYKSLYMQELS